MEDHFPFVRPRILRWLWQQREALKIHRHRSASLPFLPSWDGEMNSMVFQDYRPARWNAGIGGGSHTSRSAPQRRCGTPVVLSSLCAAGRNRVHITRCFGVALPSETPSVHSQPLVVEQMLSFDLVCGSKHRTGASGKMIPSCFLLFYFLKLIINWQFGLWHWLIGYVATSQTGELLPAEAQLSKVWSSLIYTVYL